ncbi:hypothetical protein DFJ58DRAFT_848593 [Suillus subalutaceus]|uniref:uncharacterized protein n=1 Tax=Suillus subalutaceus TaxID=48586 RepID=UPI001B881AFE|nr:uncharacterized protein DFJ58DRAFT_848593 [Suillus subalutaceus]KAG1829891.1 hypothetical protein DFJ58DRAFT_848593 [Suillus subalutaceus]
MFCKINKVIDIGTLLKRHELADAGQLSEDEDDIAHRENQLAELFGYGKTRDRFQRNYKRLLELALGLKARSDDSTRLKIQIGKYVALDPAKKLHPRTGPSTALGSQSRGARPCNAVLHDMTTVEAAHIAYGRVQTEEDGDFKYRDFYRNIVELIEDLLDDDREQIFKEWNMKLFNNDDGRDVARDDAEDSALSSTREGGSDLARLRAQMAARNAAAKTDTTDLERPAAPPTVAHPPSAPRTPPPSSPACILSTPRPVPRPAKTPDSPAPLPRTPLASSSARNIPLPSRPASSPAKTVSRVPAKTVSDSQANGGASGSELTESVETSDDEPPLLKTWSHPTLLSPIKDTIVVFQPNEFIYNVDILHAGREQDDNNDNPVVDDNVDEDEQPNNMPFNVSEFPRQLAAYPALNAPSTALTQRHALMIVMFIAHAFTEMLLQDIHCRERYPVPLTRAAVKESTDILGRVDENHRRIILRLEDFKRLSHILNTGWDDWVAQAPPSWKEDNFLTNNAPVGVTIRYGQNQPLLVHGALDDERRNWDNDRNYTHIRQFTFSLATHISYLDVREWREVPNFQNGGGIIYDKSNDDPMRTEVNLEDLPLLDGDGYEINVYNEQGFRVPRRAPVQFSICGALLNLHSVHELFRSDDDNTRNKAHFDNSLRGGSGSNRACCKPGTQILLRRSVTMMEANYVEEMKLARRKSIVGIVNITEIHLARYDNTVEDVRRVGRLVAVV